MKAALSLARWVPDIARRQTLTEVRAGLKLLASQRESELRLVFGLWERASGRFVGEVGLYQLDWSLRSAETGYWLRASARGRGFASEGLQLVCTLASRRFALRQLEAHIAPDNLASRRVAESTRLPPNWPAPGRPGMGWRHCPRPDLYAGAGSRVDLGMPRRVYVYIGAVGAFARSSSAARSSCRRDRSTGHGGAPPSFYSPSFSVSAARWRSPANRIRLPTSSPSQLFPTWPPPFSCLPG